MRSFSGNCSESCRFPFSICQPGTGMNVFQTKNISILANVNIDTYRISTDTFTGSFHLGHNPPSHLTGCIYSNLKPIKRFRNRGIFIALLTRRTYSLAIIFQNGIFCRYVRKFLPARTHPAKRYGNSCKRFFQ